MIQCSYNLLVCQVKSIHLYFCIWKNIGFYLRQESLMKFYYKQDNTNERIIQKNPCLNVLLTIKRKFLQNLRIKCKET